MHAVQGVTPMRDNPLAVGDETQHPDTCFLFFIQDRLRRLSCLGALVISLHTGTSYLEERLFKHLAFTSAFFMVLVVCVIYIAGYLAARAWAHRGNRDRPVLQIGLSRGERLMMAALCLAYVGSNTLSKLSLNYVTMPMMCVSLFLSLSALNYVTMPMMCVSLFLSLSACEGRGGPG